MIAAVDIGGTRIAIGMVDSEGHVLSRAQSPTAGGSNEHHDPVTGKVHVATG